MKDEPTGFELTAPYAFVPGLLTGSFESTSKLQKRLVFFFLKKKIQLNWRDLKAAAARGCRCVRGLVGAKCLISHSCIHVVQVIDFLDHCLREQLNVEQHLKKLMFMSVTKFAFTANMPERRADKKIQLDPHFRVSSNFFQEQAEQQ